MTATIPPQCFALPLSRCSQLTTYGLPGLPSSWVKIPPGATRVDCCNLTPRSDRASAVASCVCVRHGWDADEGQPTGRTHAPTTTGCRVQLIRRQGARRAEAAARVVHQHGAQAHSARGAGAFRAVGAAARGAHLPAPVSDGGGAGPGRDGQGRGGREGSSGDRPRGAFRGIIEQIIHWDTRSTWCS